MSLKLTNSQIHQDNIVANNAGELDFEEFKPPVDVYVYLKVSSILGFGDLSNFDFRTEEIQFTSNISYLTTTIVAQLNSRRYRSSMISSHHLRFPTNFDSTTDITTIFRKRICNEPSF